MQIRKKALFKDFTLYFFRLLIVILTLTAVVIVVEVFKSNTLNTEKLEMYGLYYRIYYSDVIMVKEDGVIKTGVINHTKISTSNLESAINYLVKDQIAAKVTLISEFESPREAYINEVWYGRWMRKVGFEGWGSASKIFVETPVSYYYHGKLTPAVLEISVVMP